MNGRKSRAISRAARDLGAKTTTYIQGRYGELRCKPDSYRAVRKMLKREGVLVKQA